MYFLFLYLNEIHEFVAWIVRYMSLFFNIFFWKISEQDIRRNIIKQYWIIFYFRNAG